jgi:hypothetical protein
MRAQRAVHGVLPCAWPSGCLHPVAVSASLLLTPSPPCAPPPLLPAPGRDATSLAHQYEVYAAQLELSVVDDVLLVRACVGLSRGWRCCVLRARAQRRYAVGAAAPSLVPGL